LIVFGLQDSGSLEAVNVMRLIGLGIRWLVQGHPTFWSEIIHMMNKVVSNPTQ
jgi:hypothetical protein